MKSESSSSFTLYHLEVLILAGTLLTTVTISALTLRQTTRNFEIQRTSEFVARLNSRELVTIREHADRWLEKRESPADLYDHSVGKFSTPPSNKEQERIATEAALETVSELRTLTNFFQEFGTALKVDSLDERYAHALIGGLCIRYGIDLQPFIEETRRRKGRAQAYSEVYLLKERMEFLDKAEK